MTDKLKGSGVDIDRIIAVQMIFLANVHVGVNKCYTDA